MPLATEHYRALVNAVDYKKLSNAEDACAELRKIVADTQQLTLSQLNDPVSRQLGSILFSHEAGLISALSTVNPPEVKERKPQGFPLHILFFGCGIAVAAAAAALTWNGGHYITAALIVCGQILGALATFWPHRKPRLEVSQTVNARALFDLAERRMQAIDRDMEAFLRLPTVDDDADANVLQLITKAVTFKREDPDSIPDELMTTITALTLSRGYRFIDYSGEEDMYFDIMPTKRDTRTIVPAVMKDDHLIARGMAIVHISQEDAQEEQIG